MLPDRSVLIGQKLVENAKLQKFKCDILSNFKQCECAQISKKVSSNEIFQRFFEIFFLFDFIAFFTESLAATLAMQLVEVELSKTLKSIFIDKPENCEEISKREVNTFVMADGTNEIEAIGYINTFDLDRDGIITCKGNTFNL